MSLEIESLNRWTSKQRFFYENVNEKIHVKQVIELNVKNSICKFNKVLYDFNQSVMTKRLALFSYQRIKRHNIEIIISNNLFIIQVFYFNLMLRFNSDADIIFLLIRLIFTSAIANTIVLYNQS